MHQTTQHLNILNTNRAEGRNRQQYKNSKGFQYTLSTTDGL